MIEFSFSGEIDGEAYDTFRPIRNEIKKLLNEELGKNNYGDGIDEIFLAPMLLGPKFIEGNKERRLFKKKKKVADYRLIIDFDRWQAADTELRRSLIINNLIDAVNDLNTKLKGSFEGEVLIGDINKLFKNS